MGWLEELRILHYKKNGYALPKALLHRHGSVDYVVYAFLSTPPSGEN